MSDLKALSFGAGAPAVVVVGSASRDLTDEDPRGWRLGGGVTYGALTLARLGIRTAALIGVDGEAAGAAELDILRAAGVDMALVPLARGPVFVNQETPHGRVQIAMEVSDQLPTSALPAAWDTSAGWLLALVAGELPEEWANVPAADATVALGWQGLLRTLRAGERVARRDPWPSALLARADLIGVSRHDLPGDWNLAAADSLIAPAAELLLSAGEGGALLLRLPTSSRRAMRVRAIPAQANVDATGAGDVALASLLAARLVAGDAGAAVDWSASRRRHLRLAAAAASLTVEQSGILGVPTLAAIRDRLSPRNPKPQAP